MDELRSLAESAGYTVVESLEQIREPDPRYQIGSGKAEELAELIAANGVETAIFDNELKPAQAHNLAKATGVEPIDRFQLILQIFARRASTSEAKLQIQLAQLQYELPRAKEKVKLARLSEQPGFKGLGKYEVDLYYENVKQRIHNIRAKLKKKRKKRHLHRTRRAELGFPTISLAGYTNAGKSSLFNALVKENAPADPGLFTTLSTTTRMVNLSGRNALLTDTVGFIDRLPLKLIEAFNSTLEETIFSDLILLVVDVSESQEEIEKKLYCCLDTIRKIGATGIPIVTALNKTDLLSEGELQSKRDVLEGVATDSVPISALHETNIDVLEHAIVDHLESYIQVSFSIPLADESMSFLSWLFERADVLHVEYEGKNANVVFKAVPWFADKVRGRAEKLGAVFNG
ncbi:MAG: GTPase HflX [Candidatus Bathyarchaeota archaeon]|nr:MAG: GTPase HflX [Candidatus Bathyarchaeota archaeon]